MSGLVVYGDVGIRLHLEIVRSLQVSPSFEYNIDSCEKNVIAVFDD